MPKTIKFDKPPAGYSLGAARADETVSVQYLEFTSSEDGQHFVQRLEGIPNDILTMGWPEVNPSLVDNLLAIISRDGTTTAFLNELPQRLLVRGSKGFAKGEVVRKSDIVDIERLELGVEVPNDAAVVFVFSIRWRKGLFYDFGPIGRIDPQPRTYDLESTLGQAFCHVMFQERFGLSDAEWQALFNAKWFLFAGLNQQLDSVIAHVRAGWDPDDRLDDITAELKGRAQELVDKWSRSSSFAPHIDILRHAIDRFRNDDFVSCTGLLFPRIEGLLRTHHTSLGTKTKPNQGNLTQSAVAAKTDTHTSLLLPHRFAEYLQNIYFADFNPVSQEIDVSRHSVAHGVAAPTAFNRKSAVIGILVTDQLFYFLNNKNDATPGCATLEQAETQPAPTPTGQSGRSVDGGQESEEPPQNTLVSSESPAPPPQGQLLVPEQANPKV